MMHKEFVSKYVCTYGHFVNLSCQQKDQWENKIEVYWR
jgi:hypothetical protein